MFIYVQVSVPVYLSKFEKDYSILFPGIKGFLFYFDVTSRKTHKEILGSVLFYFFLSGDDKERGEEGLRFTLSLSRHIFSSRG